MGTKLARITKQVVSLTHQAVVGNRNRQYSIVAAVRRLGYLTIQVSERISTCRTYDQACGRAGVKIALRRDILRPSVELGNTGEVQVIDATGMDRTAVGQHCAKRTKYTFKAVKTTALTNWDTGVILDIHC